jgi:hypothetical protein
MPFGPTNGPAMFISFIHDVDSQWKAIIQQTGLIVDDNTNTKIIVYDIFSWAKLLETALLYEINVSPEMEFFLVFNLCRNVLYFCNTFMRPSPKAVSAPTTCFLLTVVVSGFVPYNHLLPNNAPAKCAGVTPTPWAMMPTLSFVSYHWGRELLVTPSPRRIFRVFF